MKGDYIPTLDGWRAIAILSVVFCHSGALLFGATGYWPSARGYDLAAHGIVGVDIFFALSGFLITSRLIGERTRTGGINLPAFYRRRFFRILPAYWAFLAVLGLASLAGIVRVEWGDILSCLLFWRNYTESFSWYTGHFWSLAVEEHFYFLWPTALALLSIRRARWAGVAVAFGIEIWRALDGRLLLMQHWFPGTGSNLHRTDTRLDALLWGSLAAIAFPAIARVMSKLPGKTGHFLPIALGSAVLLGLIVDAPLLPFWKALLLPVLLVSTIIFPASPLSLALELPGVRWIGRLSYSLYLWHVPFLTPEAARSPQLGILQHLPLALIVPFACAAASFYLIEQPCIAIGHRAGRRRPVPVSAAA